MESEEIEKYKEAGHIAKEAKNLAAEIVKIGASDLDVAEKLEEFILSKTGERGGLAFPVSVCVNEIAAHKTPSIQNPYLFKKGDVVKIDLGVHINGYIADTATTFDFGDNKNLLQTNKLALKKAIEAIKKDKPLGDLGKIVEQTMKGGGFMPITNLAGHQIKPYNIHAGVSVPNCETNNQAKFQKGEAYAIEPFATTGCGLVVSSAGGGIMKVLKPEAKPRLETSRTILKYVIDNFGLFEFSKRNILKKYPNAQLFIESLKKDGVLYEYPGLKEKTNAVVSQFEDTILVLGDGKIIITTS